MFKVPPKSAPQVDLILYNSNILIPFRVRQDSPFWGAIREIDLDSKQGDAKNIRIQMLYEEFQPNGRLNVTVFLRFH